MNCDTAFDLMTDSHGSRSGALAEHFDSCPRCRRMQEALSPALDFLAESGPYDGTGNHGRETSAASANREPFVTTEAVQVARQAAASLTVHTDMPRVCLLRLAGRTVKYAAAFAAGLLLAVVLFSQRDRSAPPAGTTCTRRAASQDDPSRTTDQIQTLAQSCAVCHQTSPARRDDHSMNSPARTIQSWDWLLPLLEDQPQRTFENPGFEAGQMIVDQTKRSPAYAQLS